MVGADAFIEVVSRGVEAERRFKHAADDVMERIEGCDSEELEVQGAVMLAMVHEVGRAIAWEHLRT